MDRTRSRRVRRLPRRRGLALLWSLGLLVTLVGPGVQIALGATFTVNQVGDQPDAALADPNCDHDLGTIGNQCTLRAAIQEANDTAGSDTIAFTIPGAGPHTITPASALPAITDAVLLDGYSQPGAIQNTLADANNAVIRIELDGSAVGGGASGLDVRASNSTVQGVAINRFTGMGATGILVSGSMATPLTSVTIRGAFVGTDPSGTLDLGNTTGIFVSDFVSSSSIGGTTPQARNVISGNDTGLRIEGTATTSVGVQGDHIGTNADGNAPLPNVIGVLIDDSSGNTVGGSTQGARNVISGNGSYGLALTGTTQNTQVQGNHIGVGPDGSADVGNSIGILLFAASNSIGGAAIGAGNVISGNDAYGVYIQGASASGNIVAGNIVGLDATGSTAVPNSNSGIVLVLAPGNIIGGTTPGAGNTVSANAAYGLAIQASADGNLVQGNRIGTDITGAVARGNGLVGVFMAGVAGNTVGGSGAGAGNVISGNGTAGVYLLSATTTGNTIEGNLIGTDATGLIDLGNVFGVAFDGASANLVGGAVTGARNIISGNVEGIFYSNGASGNLVQGNRIGTDVTGNAALPNADFGVVLDGSAGTGNVIGGPAPGAGNLISGNGSNGIGVAAGSPNQTVVQNNLIGTNAAGTADIGNGADGIGIDTSDNQVLGNVISGNATDGLELSQAGSTGNVVQGNRIGTDAAGTAAIPNDDIGLRLTDVKSTTIGGTGAGEANVIAFNLDEGVYATSGVDGARIRANAIHGNGGLGIDLDAIGPTPNDSDDPDSGANRRQNHPQLSAASTTTASGSLDSTASTAFTIDFFSSPACDASGFGEGHTYLGSVAVNTNASGDASFSNAAFATSAAAGSAITATATADGTGDTSEFSPCVQLPTPPPPSPSASSSPTASASAPASASATASASAGASASSGASASASSGASPSTGPSASPAVGVCGRILSGTPGNDLLIGTAVREQLVGLGGDDSIKGGDGNDCLQGGSGIDRLAGQAGADVLRGGSGNDTLIGALGIDRLFGGAGNDTIYGGLGDDLVNGGLGSDSLVGGPGSNTLIGGGGDDSIDARNGARDVIVCGAGVDTVRADVGDRINAKAGCEQIILGAPRTPASVGLRTASGGW